MCPWLLNGQCSDSRGGRGSFSKFITLCLKDSFFLKLRLKYTVVVVVLLCYIEYVCLTSFNAPLSIQVSVRIYHRLMVVQLTMILRGFLRGHSVPLPPTTAPWEHLLVLQPGLVIMENGLGLHHRAKTLVCSGFSKLCVLHCIAIIYTSHSYFSQSMLWLRTKFKQ